MLFGSIMICLRIQEKYYLDPIYDIKNSTPPPPRRQHTLQNYAQLTRVQFNSVHTGRIQARPSSGINKLKDPQFRMEPSHDAELKN